MNKNSYFSLNDIAKAKDYLQFGLIEQGPIKEKKMDSKLKYHVVDGQWGGVSSYETMDEALKAAKKMTMNTKEDTVIRQDVAVVRFPIPDYEVETLVPGTTV